MCMGSKGCHGICFNKKVPRNDILETIFRESLTLIGKNQDGAKVAQ